MKRRTSIALAWMLALGCPALWACSLCTAGSSNVSSWREDIGAARFVLYGTLNNARILADGASGATDLQIETILKNDPALANQKTVTIGRYVPVDPKAPAKFLVFCDIYNGKVDAFRGNPVKSAAVVEYVRGLAALPADRTKQLLYYFRFLDHSDADIANDAFLEFAKTGDADIARVARQLD